MKKIAALAALCIATLPAHADPFWLYFRQAFSFFGG
jgi:hypothetical protein